MTNASTRQRHAGRFRVAVFAGVFVCLAVLARIFTKPHGDHRSPGQPSAEASIIMDHKEPERDRVFEMYRPTNTIATSAPQSIPLFPKRKEMVQRDRVGDAPSEPKTPNATPLPQPAPQLMRPVTVSGRAKGVNAPSEMPVQPMRAPPRELPVQPSQFLVQPMRGAVSPGAEADFEEGNIRTDKKPSFRVPDVVAAANAVVIAITRDDAALLPTGLEIVRGCMAAFNAYDFIIIENDSSDGTQALLRSLAARDRRIIVESRNMTSTGKKPSIGFMSALRNRGLELAYLLSYSSTLRHDWSADLVVVIDLDVAAVDAKGFVQAAEQILSGRSMAGATPNGVQQDGRYYDLYAFRSCNLHYNPKAGPIMKRVDDSHWPRLMPLYTADLPPFPVDSAFSGAAIYRADIVFGPRMWLPKQPGKTEISRKEGKPGSLTDARTRVPQWRGAELVSRFPPPGPPGSTKGMRPRKGDPGGDPKSPKYFAAVAVFIPLNAKYR